MLRVKVKKLWQGRFASIRDYQLNQAKKKGGLIVTFDDDFMTLKTHELEGLEPRGQFVGHFGKKYQLVDIPWKANTKDNANQGDLFNG